jgi:hypothetical protein
MLRQSRDDFAALDLRQLQARAKRVFSKRLSGRRHDLMVP